MTQPAEPAATVRAVATGTITKAFQDAVCGPAHLGSAEVIWSDGSAQILLHAGKLQAITQGNILVVAVDTESAEFGVAPLVVRFVFGSEKDPGFLIAATDETALGHPQVAARWGELFRDVIWAAFARLAEVSAAGSSPAGLRLSTDGLELITREPVPVLQLARDHVQELVRSGVRQAGRSPASTGGTAGPESAAAGGTGEPA
jgi:hypothetical protein